MTRTEFLQRLILNSMCDDFENVDQVILSNVAAAAAKCGLTVERTEVVQNLRALVEAGLAKAYDLSAAMVDPFSGEFRGMPRSMFLRRTSGPTSIQRRREWNSTNRMECGGPLMTMISFGPRGTRRVIDGQRYGFRRRHLNGAFAAGLD